MKTKQELEFVENLVKRTYNNKNWGNILKEKLDKPYNPQNPELGYSYRSQSIDSNGKKEFTIYNVVCAHTGVYDIDYRVKLHEYGHIYLAHLDGIYEEMDTRICNVFRDYRGELIETINKNCGIDFGDKLIERVIDDPVLNHSLHNIAMDMEVNTKVLSKDDVEVMEKEVSKTIQDSLSDKLKELLKTTKDEEVRKKIEDRLKKMENEAKIKFILPERYHTPDGQPFPDNADYLEYLLLIVKNLDQFVKMMISISKGGNGDTSDVSTEDVKDALGDESSAMSNLDDLMEQMGMSDSKKSDSNSDGEKEGQGGNGGEDGQQGNDSSNSGGYKGDSEEIKSGNQGVRDDEFSELDGGTHHDHCTNSRDEADKKREVGEIKAGGGTGCGKSGSSGSRRKVVNEDPVDEAIDQVLRNYKNKVVKKEIKKDMMWNYNKGINRTVIAPAILPRVTIKDEPKIVYLIDVSGSMDTVLVDRVLSTIARKMKSIGRGLHYDIISWSTKLEDHFRDIDPRKGIPSISVGGGTRMAKGIKYFRDHYKDDSILVVISDFEDYLEEWHEVEKTMNKYALYGFNYGCRNYKTNFKNLIVKNFNVSYNDHRY